MTSWIFMVNCRMRESGAAFSPWNSIWSVWVSEAKKPRALQLHVKSVQANHSKSMCLWNLDFSWFWIHCISCISRQNLIRLLRCRQAFGTWGVTIAKLLDHYAEEPHLSHRLSGLVQLRTSIVKSMACLHGWYDAEMLNGTDACWTVLRWLRWIFQYSIFSSFIAPF